MPPHVIVMATGPEGDAYYEIGKRYSAALARADVELRVVPTAGSVENLDMLLDGRSEVSVALIDGGINSAGASGLESLGTVFYEPLWWFRRRGSQAEGAAGLQGRKISIGPEGSGTRALSLQLVKRTGLEGRIGEVLALTPQAAGEKLLAGEIDAAFVMTTWESPLVQQLLADDRIGLSPFPHADAFVALYPFLSKVTVPRGVTDFAKDQPPADVVLIATKASLVVRKDLHPAIQYLLLNAAREIHSGASIFSSHQRVSRRRSHRHSAEQRSAAVLQIWPAIPARLLSILDGGADRQADHPAHSDPRRALPDDAISASPA